MECGLSETSPSWWSRIFRRSQAETPIVKTSHATGEHFGEIPVAGATVGLCFDYERDLNMDSAPELSDFGIEHILAVLKRRKVRATFNCAAKLCEEMLHQIRRIADAGHELAVYGYAGESWADLDAVAIKQLLYKCRAAFSRAGLSPIGFRSKSTQCNAVMAHELVLQRFRYNSQHDHAKHPYICLKDDPPLARIPVATDDRGYVRGQKKEQEEASKVISKHDRYLRKALVRGHFISIAYHPWILAEDKNRMREWETWLDVAIKSGAKVGALEDALPAEYRALTSIEDAVEDEE